MSSNNTFKSVVIPHDFFTHEASWRMALERLIELEPESLEPGMDEKGYWRHELAAFNKAYSELRRICGIRPLQ